MTVRFGPPYTAAVRRASVERISVLNPATGAIDFTNRQDIAGSVVLFAGFVALSPIIPFGFPRITVTANLFWVASIVNAAALPGYASAELLVNITVLGMMPDIVRAGSVSVPITEAFASRMRIRRFVAPAFWGGGIDVVNEAVNPTLSFTRFDARMPQRYVVTVTLEAWAGCGGWASAECSVHEGSLDGITIDFV